MRKIVVLTGAGISAESGINTFRGQDGLWEQHAIEDVASPEGFRRDAALVHRFYNERRRKLLEPDLLPNDGHRSLVELAQEADLFLITQNVDNLHEKAGQPQVLHMHGELFKVRCQISQQVFSWDKDTSPTLPCPCCQKAGGLRPHIVWFGEEPLAMADIFAALSQATDFAAIGTSGQVYPAAGFVQAARRAGAYCVEINPEPTGNRLFHKVIAAPASTGVRTWISSLGTTNGY